MSILVLGPGQSRVFRTLWMLGEIAAVRQLEYDHQVNGMPSDQDMEFVRSLNPMAQFPVIKDDDFVLRESMAINLYLAEKYDVLHPSALEERALVYQWSFWVMTAVETPALNALKHTFGMMGFDQDAAKVEENGVLLERPLRVLDAELAESNYLLGEEFTVADLNVASVFNWINMADLNISQYVHAMRWFQQCIGRDVPSKLLSAG